MSGVTLSRFESLSNDVLLEILEYLDAYTLCSAFYGVNRRFNALLRSCHLHVVLDESKRDTTLWNTVASFTDHCKIHYLSFHDRCGTIDKRFLPSSSQTLRSLSIQGMDKASMDLVLHHLPLGNQIKHLNISSSFADGFRVYSLVNFVFCKHGNRFSSLVNCALQLRSVRGEFPRITAVFPYLRRLSINRCLWPSNTVLFLHENTPNLRSLHMWPLSELSDTLLSSNCVLNHVRELEIVYSSISPNLKTFLTLFPNLRRLHVKWREIQWFSVLAGTEWQKIIEAHLSHLQQMTLDFCDIASNGLDEQIVRTFQTGEFWSKKPVVIKMKTDNLGPRYRRVEAIYFGQQWEF